MKELILTLLIGVFVMAGTAVAQATNTKTAVMYFSATGTTERMAKNAASAMGADIFEIEPAHKYTSADLNWNDRKSLTSIECNDLKSRPTIAHPIDISTYDSRIATRYLPSFRIV